jgi:hypothetical protein
MEANEPKHITGNTACQCPMCTATPAPTYTREYMMDCLVRWYANQLPQVQNEFLAARRRKFGSEAGMAEIKEAAKRLGLNLDF